MAYVAYVLRAERAMQGHVLAHAELIGTYPRR